MWRVALALLLLSSLVVTDEVLADVCQHMNSANGLTYDLLPMARGSFQVDYHLAIVDPSASTYNTFFVNICDNTKETCPSTPVCEQNICLDPNCVSAPVSWGSLDFTSWLPYQPDPTADGITLRYSSDTFCTDEENYVTSFINVLCDPAILQGVIDTVITSADECTTSVAMRSRFGCGFPVNQPLDCSAQIPPEPVACTSSGQGNFDCSAGHFELQVTGNQNVPKYTFAATSSYNYAYYEDSVEAAGDEDDHHGSTSGAYKLMFHKLLETDAKGKKTAQVSLPSISWEFTMPEVVVHDDVDCSQETTFNITNTDGPYWTKLVLVNHLAMTDGTSAVKFDVVIEDYEWQSAASTHLVLDVSLSGPSSSTDSTNSTTVGVGAAYLAVDPVAYAYADASDPMINQTIAVSMTSSGGSQSILYDRFVGSLVHDPVVGLTNAWKIPPPAPCNQGSCEFAGFSLVARTSEGPELTLSLGPSWTVHFTGLVERGTSSQVAGSALDLNTLEWAVSPAVSSVLEDGTAQVALSLTTGAGARWSSLEIEVLSSMAAGVSHVDLVLRINDYEWVSDSRTAALQLLADVEGSGAIAYTYDAIVVGDNYLAAGPMATAKSATSQQLSTLSLAYLNGALATFSHFEGSLTAGLSMGISSSTDPFTPNTEMVPVEGTTGSLPDDSSSTWWMWLLVALGVSCGIALAVGLSVLVVKRRSSYESLT